MKSALVLVVVIVLAVLFAGVGFLFTTGTHVSHEHHEAPIVRREADPALEASTERQLLDLRSEIGHLTTLVAELQTQVAQLESSASREAVAIEQVAAPVESAALAPAELASTVNELIEAKEEREEAERAAQRAERDLENATRQAERIAKDLGMSPVDQGVLADHLYLTRQKRNEAIAEARENGFDREGMRSTFEEMRTWNDNELERLFGTDLGAQIGEKTDDFGRGGRRGGNGGGGDGGGRGQRNRGGGGN